VSTGSEAEAEAKPDVGSGEEGTPGSGALASGVAADANLDCSTPVPSQSSAQAPPPSSPQNNVQ